MKLAPARLAPVFVPRIWGAKTLTPLFNAPPGLGPIGEVWLTGDACTFADGPFAGRPLGEVWPSLPAVWTGTRIRNAPRIPLLAKFLFPEDKLSVQVHPNDEYARLHESRRGAGAVGKTEMWHVLAAREGAAIAVGLEPGVNKESFQQAISRGATESTLHAIQVKSGDTFFVPAGTPHMIGPGMVLCEIQQNSDITYRVFDFHRLQSDGTPRELHIARALDVLRFGAPLGGAAEPVCIEAGALKKAYLAACPYFCAEKWEFSAAITGSTAEDRFEVLIFLAGSGEIESDSASLRYGPAEVRLLPAALGTWRLIPASPTALLRTYVPDLPELARQIASENVPQDALSRLIRG